MTYQNCDWNEEQVETLKTMWEAGYSCSQIARQIPGASRSAVIGKVHRLKLPSRENPSHSQFKEAVKSKSAKPLPKPKDLPVVLVPFLLAGELVSTETLHPTLMCKWPIGDPLEPGFHFCGNSPMFGRPYCECHAKVAYQPAHTRPEGGGQHREKLRPGQTSLWK
jgi:GcrA cell cycle regulator